MVGHFIDIRAIVNKGRFARFIIQTNSNGFLEILPMNQCTESAYGLITQSIQFLRIAMPLLQNLLYISQCHQDRAFTHAVRSEEHTSELQSRGHLVCRLLLEKKKRGRKMKREDYRVTGWRSI